MANTLVQTWQRLLLFDPQPWVAFENGTCVLLAQPEANLEVQAQAILATVRSAKGDRASAEMKVTSPVEVPGWVVAGFDPSIWAYVSFEEAGGPDARKEDVGLLGRAKMEKDAETLKVIHVEERPR
jgi:hypothetical protein